MSDWNPSGTYSYLWFKNYTLPVWEKLLLPHLGDVRNYLEIGVAEGLSMRWVLEHLLDGKQDAMAVGVDPYWPARQFGDHPREAKQRRLCMAENLTLWAAGPGCQMPVEPQIPVIFSKPGGPVVETCIESSESFLIQQSTPERFDLIYVDGNHNASAALLDVVLCWRLLKVGGIMVVDDIDQRYRGNQPRAWHACRALEDCYEGMYDVVFRHHRQVAFRKIERRRKGHPPVLAYGPAIPPLT